jgi:AmpD protein
VSCALFEEADMNNGWLQGVRRVPSVNFNDRPENMPVDLLVIHNISLPPGEFSADDLSCSYIDDLFCNQLDVYAHPAFVSLQSLRVSSHFLISRQGVVTQYVPLTKRAWHAGISQWQGRENCNDYSVGIELEGTDNTPYTDHQYAVLTQLTQMLIQQYPAITSERIVGHCDVAPDRKTDPGVAFDWGRYRSSLHG